MASQQAWYPVAFAQKPPARPLGVTLQGRRWVLFPDGEGGVGALEDRCPHRGVSLSLGRAVAGTVACAYHGWRFDRGGALVHVPSALEDEKLPPCRVPAAAACLQEGTLWLHPEGTPEGPPPGWPSHGAPGYRSFELVTDVAAPAVWVLQNFVDCAHTGILHRGLFRGEPERAVRAQIRMDAEGVRVETLGEGNPQSLLSRLFARGAGELRHTDSFRPPHTVEVNYRWGERHVVTTSLCVPVEEGRTRIYTRVTLRAGALTALVLQALRPLTRRVLEQDRGILEDQAEQLRRYPERGFASSRSDLPCLWLEERQAQAQRGEAPEREREREISYRL